MENNVEASIKGKGLSLDNYLSHLDEMTDEEIAYMLTKEPDAKVISEMMRASISTAREMAEDKRDFDF